VLTPELGVHILEVLANRARREPELACDLGVGLAASDPGKYLALAGGQLDRCLPLFETHMGIDQVPLDVRRVRFLPSHMDLRPQSPPRASLNRRW
jgi:hypothetical protein